MTTLIEHHLHERPNLLGDRAARLVLALPVSAGLLSVVAAVLCARLGA